MVVVEGATLATFVTGPITMIIIGILLNIVGLGIFCWALFALAIHALPFFVGMTVGIYSFRAGAGPHQDRHSQRQPAAFGEPPAGRHGHAARHVVRLDRGTG